MISLEEKRKCIAAAIEPFEHLWDEAKLKFAFGQNIAETAEFVGAGNADAGLVALSLVIAQPAPLTQTGTP